MAQQEAIISGMAGRYASALFALAQEQRATDQVGADLDTFARLIDESPDFARFVRSPVFTAESQVKALTAILEGAGIRGPAANFIKLVASKRRLFAIRDMIGAYRALNDAAKGVARAEVTVAEPLAEHHRGALEDALKEVTGGKSVNVAFKADPSIIGGLIVRLGSRMVDASLKTKLNAIRMLMKEAG
ncbi:MAG: F0F1 ATP synthase subunit delta [Methylobacteriaceae bacterium]|nr:F0F1 ATP synthase subunit delta [Methylobacteriaceae bacterium]